MVSKALAMESIQAVAILVGPGNAIVAEAKRQLYGRVEAETQRSRRMVSTSFRSVKPSLIRRWIVCEKE